MRFRIFKTEAERTKYFEDVRFAANAVVEAGRPHKMQVSVTNLGCLCAKCIAWDDLAKLLRTP